MGDNARGGLRPAQTIAALGTPPERPPRTRGLRDRRARRAPVGARCLFAWLSVVIAAPLSALAEKPAVPAPSPATAAPAAIIELAPPGDPAWTPLHFRSIDRATRYEVRSDPQGRPAYRAVSQCGASAMLVPLPADLDLDRTPRLAWRWRVERGLEIADETSAKGDDFAARVYVLFEFDPERASTWARMEHSLGRRLFGAETPGQAINYVWASHQPVGATWTSPHRSEARLLAVASGSGRTSPPSRAAGEVRPDDFRSTAEHGHDASPWREVVVDLRRDAQRLFEVAPRKRPYALGLMTDADGICSEAVAWYSDFRLLAPAR